MTELDQLVPAGTPLEVAGVALVLQPLRIGQMPGFLRAISPALQQLQSPPIDWLTVLGEHGDELLGAVAIAIDRPRAWVDALAADEALVLVAKVIEVNADFFTRRVLPKLDGLFGQAQAVMASPQVHRPSGSMPSSA